MIMNHLDSMTSAVLASGATHCGIGRGTGGGTIRDFKLQLRKAMAKRGMRNLNWRDQGPGPALPVLCFFPELKR